MINHIEFLFLASQMRDAQKRYFKERRPEVLRACKMLEKQVDVAIMDLKAMTIGEQPIIGGQPHGEY